MKIAEKFQFQLDSYMNSCVKKFSQVLRSKPPPRVIGFYQCTTLAGEQVPALERTKRSYKHGTSAAVDATAELLRRRTTKEGRRKSEEATAR